METISSGMKKLPILNNKIELDVDAELKAFELEQMAALGLEPGKEHWRDDNPTKFIESQRAHTTILISGLTMAHDFFLQGALRGIGYKVQAIDCPNNAALADGQGVRQPRAVQPDLLHRRQPGQVPDLPARREEDPGRRDRRELRLRDGGRVWPVPLRHLRHRVSQGAA